MSAENHGYMVHCMGEKLHSLQGKGVYDNVVEVFEYDFDSYIVGRRYTAVEGQGLVEVSYYRDLEVAKLKAWYMSRRSPD